MRPLAVLDIGSPGNWQLIGWREGWFWLLGGKAVTVQALRVTSAEWSAQLCREGQQVSLSSLRDLSE